MWYYILRGTSVSVCSAVLASLLSTSIYAQTITFRKVADTNTPVPGGAGTFTSFSSTPVIDRGNVAFVGTTAPMIGGVFTDIGGTLRQVATSTTVGPSGIGKFTSAFVPSIDNGQVAFRGVVRLADGSSVASGVYLEDSGTISEVAVTGTPAPNGGVFNFFDSSEFARPSLNAGNVAFSARTSDVGFGVFLLSGGSLSVVADVNTIRPGGTEPFSLIIGMPYLSGDNIAFVGFGTSGVKGVYASIGGVLSVVADNTMTHPGGTTTFSGPTSPVIDGRDIAFIDLGSSSQFTDAQEGSYTYFDGVLNAGILGAPIAPGSPSLENRIIVANRGPGIISTNMGGSEFHVIGSGDILDGKSLSIAYQSREALSVNEIVFFAFFDDQSQGIYVAQIELICGNQVIDPGEECDDGGGSAACDFDCTFPACGDDVLNTFAGEQCDDGVNNSDTIVDACRTNCQLPSCGDGVIDTGEVCDDGASNSDSAADACRLDCTLARCGDSVIDTGEACDDGALNSDTAADACRLDCTLPRCGDGAIDTVEDCDDVGQSSTCDTDCSFAECGDATTNALAGEQCDNGFNNSDTIPNACRNDCTLARCGDGVVDSAEVCDDGNIDDGDFCPSDCQEDGFVIPAMSTWGLVILALLLCVGARMQFGLRLEK